MIRVEVFTERGRITDVSVEANMVLGEVKKISNFKTRVEAKKKVFEGIVDKVCDQINCRPEDEYYEIFLTVPSRMNARNFKNPIDDSTFDDQDQPEESENSKD